MIFLCVLWVDFSWVWAGYDFSVLWVDFSRRGQSKETYGEGRAKQREEMGDVVQRESRNEMRGVRELNN